MQKSGCDFVNGCRYPLVDKNAQPTINKISNYFISWLIRFLFGIRLKDSQSGMMAFKKDILNAIKINNTKMGFSQEIKIKAFSAPAIRCGEIHITYLPRIGKPKFRKSDGINNLLSVLSLRIKLTKKEHGS
jgi:dolichol-phosphate hexosyltransferase